jgi:hypothetical protein
MFSVAKLFEKFSHFRYVKLNKGNNKITEQSGKGKVKNKRI